MIKGRLWTYLNLQKCISIGEDELQKKKKRKQKRMYVWWSLCTLYLHACQVRVTIGDL